MSDEFADSSTMQLILMAFAYSYNFTLMYFISNLILRFHGEKATLRQKSIFAFLTGAVMYTGTSYLFYYIGGQLSFDQFKYLIVVSPNPIFALIYCFLGIKILKLSSVRSIELMGNIYLYNAIINSIARLLGSIFFLQTTERFNYLLDFTMLFVNLLLFMAIYRITEMVLHHHPNFILPKTQVFVNRKKDLMIFTLKACLIYLCVVLLPTLITERVVANTLVFFFLTMFLICNLLHINYQQTKADIQKKELHIHSLIKSSDEFRALKHDFYNILQTYNGYFALGDYDACQKYHHSLVNVTLHADKSLDLSFQLHENPALVALLIEKRERAEHLGVQMEISLKCSLIALPIDEIDLCRVIACLLDNAIEAANESEPRRLSYTMEEKTATTKLIIMTNSTNMPLDTADMFIAGKTSKPGHQGIGLNTVRKIVNKYGNCTFQINSFNQEMVAYVELKS